MKKMYAHPMITVEEFTVNRAIAACGDETSRAVVFDCMIGPKRDVTNVLTTSCSRKAGTTTATVAQTYNSFSHSNVTGGTWSDSGNPRTYTAPSDAIGLVYFCSATNGSTCFSVNSEGVLVHNSSSRAHGDSYHVEVAPLYGKSVEDVNVGS